MSCKPVNITPVKPKCETCRFFKPDPNPNGSSWGECRRHAPLVVMVEPPSQGTGMFRHGGRIETRWPHVANEDSCGDYDASEAVIQAARDEFNKKYGWLLGNV